MPKLLQYAGGTLRPSSQEPDHERVPVRKWLVTGIVLASSLISSGCLFKKQARVFTPPPVVAKVTVPDRVPVTIPDSPALNIPPAEVEIPYPPNNSIPMLPAPPPPKPPPPKVKPPEPPPITVEIPPAPIVPPAAKPGQVYSAEERRIFGKDYDDSMLRVTRALSRIGSRKLSKDQQDTANAVRSLQSQAEQIKTRDLATALDLAHRADLLAKDLVSRLP